MYPKETIVTIPRMQDSKITQCPIILHFISDSVFRTQKKILGGSGLLLAL